MGFTATVRQIVDVARDRELTFMAAAITYYALASIVPLLLLALALGTLLGEDAHIESLIRDRLGDALSESGQEVLVGLLTGLSGQVGASIVGVVVALWSGSKVFRGLDVAFTKVYDRDLEPSLLDQLLDAVVVLTVLVGAFGAMILGRIVVSRFDVPVGNTTVVGTGLLFLTLLVVLLPLYYVLPPVEETLRGILPGTIVTAVGFIALQVGFLYYARYAGQYKALGILGALLLFVTWLYFGSVVLLLGATVNYVTGR